MDDTTAHTPPTIISFGTLLSAIAKKKKNQPKCLLSAIYVCLLAIFSQ
jgi:hypothetical protein